MAHAKCRDCGKTWETTGPGRPKVRCELCTRLHKDDLIEQRRKAKAEKRAKAVVRENRNGFELEPITKANYTAEVIDTCLLLLVKTGTPRRVSAIIKEAHGWDIPETTISTWRRVSYPNRYASLFVEHQPDIQRAMIQNASDEVVALANTGANLREKLDDDFDKLKPNEIATALKNVAVAQAVQTDKMLLLSGQPTQRTEATTSEDVLRNLEARGFAKRRVEDSIEGTAREIAS